MDDLLLKKHGWRLFKLMGSFYILDENGYPFACADTKEQAKENALAGKRPGASVTSFLLPCGEQQ